MSHSTTNPQKAESIALDLERETETPTGRGSFLSGRTFMIAVVCQIGLVAAGGYWANARYQNYLSDKILPEPRETPLAVLPLYNDPNVVSEEQLVRILAKLEPKFRQANPKINNIDHALRFWGVEATFANPESLSGEELRDILTDHRQFRKVWGEKTLPLIVNSEHGFRYRTQEGNATASHYDHTLAGLAEVGTPSDFPVQTPRGELPLRAAIQQAQRDFSLNQIEYEWSTLIVALYLPHAPRWISTEGQEITFDRLAERLMRQRLSLGVCNGNHRVHTLTVLLRVDEQQPILSPEMRAKVITHLKEITQRLVASQSPEGYWDYTWPGEELEGDPPKVTTGTPTAARLLVTGHVLEWWALAPAEVQPPREVVVKAGQWLVKTIDQLRPREVDQYYTFLSHAGRALSLWRGEFPARIYPKLLAK